MANFVTWLFAFVFGAVGGWALSRLGVFGSFMGGIVGTAAGIYLGRKFARHYGA